MKYNTGDTVTITHKECEVLSFDGSILTTKFENGATRTHNIKEVTVNVTKRAAKLPKYFPPQNGDVWAYDGIDGSQWAIHGNYLYDMNEHGFKNVTLEGFIAGIEKTRDRGGEPVYKLVHRPGVKIEEDES